MATTFPNVGKTFLAAAAKDQAANIYIAIGNGLTVSNWADTTPSLTDTALTDEVGRIKAAEVGYVAQDAQGTILTDLGTYSSSVTPTNYLYVRGVVPKTAAVGEYIREAGVFGRCVPPVGAAASDFIAPGDMLDTGILMGVTRFSAFERTDSTSQTFEFVIEL